MRLSLRGLMALVLVIGAALGWIVHRAQILRDAAAAIRKAGGYVEYDWQRKTGQPTRGWLADALGPDYFDPIISVTCGNATSDALIAHIGQLTRLEQLDLRDATSVTDAGIAHLGGLTRLRLLYLRGTQITDAGLAQLKELTNLEELDLDNTRVSGVGLKQLQGLTGLVDLSVSGTSVDDAGLEHIKGLTKLRFLGLSDTKVTGAGLANLKGMTSLRLLNVMGTAMSDAGLLHLRGRSTLRILNLRSTPVTDAGLAQLKDMPILTILLLEDTKVTDAGLVHLKDLPSLTNLWIGGKTTDASLASVRTLWLTDTRPPGADRVNLRLKCTALLISDTGLKVHLEALTGLRWLRPGQHVGDRRRHATRLRGLTGPSILVPGPLAQDHR